MGGGSDGKGKGREVSLNRLSNRIFKAIEIMIAVFLAVMISLVFMNVVARYVFSAGFVWSEEIARLCFVFIVYLGSIEAMRDNRHLMIDTAMRKAPRPLQAALYATAQGIVVWMMIVLTRGAWGLAVQNRRNAWIATGFPSYVVHFFGCLLGASVALIAVFNLVRLFVFKMPVSELIRIRDESEAEGEGGERNSSS